MSTQDAATNGERARKLHAESFVFDFLPLEPFIMTERHRQVMLDTLAREGTYWNAVAKTARAMMNDRLNELAASAAVREHVREVWQASGVKAVQVTLGGIEFNPTDWEGVIRDAGHWYRRVEVGGDMAICTSADALENAHKTGRIGIMLGTQDAAPIGTDLGKIDTLYNLGVRVIQLTFQNRNQIGDGCSEREQAGLSRFGVEVVRRFNELGIIVDVSHSGYKTTLDAIKLSQRPIAITHSSCKALIEHPRAKSDDQLRALADDDGYMGILAVPFFLKTEAGATLDTMLQHIEHAANILGIKRVGIGTDWAGWDPDMPEELAEASRNSFLHLGFRPEDVPRSQWQVSLPEFATWAQWPNITVGLAASGYTDDEIRGLIGGNWLSFLRRTLG